MMAAVDLGIDLMDEHIDQLMPVYRSAAEALFDPVVPVSICDI